MAIFEGPLEVFSGKALSFIYHAKNFNLDASSDALLLEGDKDLKYLQIRLAYLLFYLICEIEIKSYFTEEKKQNIVVILFIQIKSPKVYTKEP